uniref:Chromobox homolog 7b n=1 Tax=Gadus morhua TaxID=8049 RepID=A0A8C5AU27_GADMO
MELSAIGEQVFAVESILKKRVKKVCLMLCSHWLTCRYSTWEPEQHILDQRLLQAFQEKEQRDRVVGHKRKGSKVKRLLLEVNRPITDSTSCIGWSSAIGPKEKQVNSGSKKSSDWTPGQVSCGPGEVTVTDVTINSLTVTFREALVAKGFFRAWGLEF